MTVAPDIVHDPDSGGALDFAFEIQPGFFW
jgi:hypothetical protein